MSGCERANFFQRCLLTCSHTHLHSRGNQSEQEEKVLLSRRKLAVIHISKARRILQAVVYSKSVTGFLEEERIIYSRGSAAAMVEQHFGDITEHQLQHQQSGVEILDLLRRSWSAPPQSLPDC